MVDRDLESDGTALIQLFCSTRNRRRAQESPLDQRATDDSDLLSIVFLERIDPAKNAYRYCLLSVEPTLFEELCLVRESSRTGRGARRIVELDPDLATAKVELDAWLARKRRPTR